MPKPKEGHHTDTHIQRAKGFLQRWGYTHQLEARMYFHRELLGIFLAIKGKDIGAIEGNDVRG